MDWKIELVAIPVSDVDRAKAFYVDQVGFNADHDHQVSEQLRFVQLTPPGSACSVVMGTGITEMPPGSQKGVQMVVEDAAAAREQLISRGVQASDVDVQPWGSFVYFSDPDGNGWAVQQTTPRTAPAEGRSVSWGSAQPRPSHSRSRTTGWATRGGWPGPSPRAGSPRRPAGSLDTPAQPHA